MTHEIPKNPWDGSAPQNYPTKDMMQQPWKPFIAKTELGQRYRDDSTGFTGTATAVTFYQHTEPRVQLSALVDHKVVESWFDEGRLAALRGSVNLGFGEETK